MSLKIVACPHPFTSERNEHTLDAGLTYAEIVEHCIPHSAHHTIGVMRNDEPIEHSRWHEKPTDDSTIYLRAIPAGSAQEVGQDVGKVGAFAILLGAFLFIAGLATFNPALMAAGFYTFGAGVAVGVVGGIITWAGNLYDELSGLSTEESKTNPGIRGGRNSLTPWGAVPIVVGKTLVTPPYGARPYTEIGGTDGVEQYLRMLFVVGHGPLKVTQLKIGENLLATNVADIRNGTITVDGLFTGVDLEIKQGAGSMTLYPKVVVEEQPNIVLLCPGGTPTEVIRTTPPKTTEISVDITFPYGLVKYDSDGTPTNSSVNVVPEYRRKGDSTWLALGTWSGVGSTTITRDEAETKRFTCVKASLTAETYEVRMRRMTADSTDSKERNSVSWTALRSKRDEDPLSSTAQAGVVRIAIKIKATDQLNGIIDQLNMIAESVFPIYSGTGSGAAQWASSDVTRNPAAIFLALLRGSMNPRPVPDAKIDFAAIEAWYAYCITKSFACDGLISSADTLKSIMAKVTGTGRASLTMRDGLYSVIVDNARSAPVQYLTPRNSHSFKGAKAFPEKLHALKISFINADQGYAIDQCIVYDDGYNSGNATNYESIDLWGVTSYDQAWKQGRYLIACRRLRPEVFTLSVDVEHLVCTRGDMVAVSHDLPLWGLCAGRIKNVTLDGSNNIIAIDVDEACTMEAGKTYGVKIRTNAATGISAAVNLVVGEQYTLVPTTPIAPAAGVEVGNLFMFGESSSETVDCIVAGIQVNEDLSAELTLVEYAPDIQNADTGTIPAFDSKITLPANFAVESVARDIVIAPEGPPGPQGPSGGGVVPPDNNVTSVAFSSSQNADGSIHIEFSASYSQGTNPADGVFIYYKSALSAPGAFDLALDKAEWKQIGPSDTSVGHGFDVPARTGGTGGAPLHYRFGAVAGMGSKLHTSGVVTPTGWDDKTLVPIIQDIDFNLYDKSFTSYEGSGVFRRAVRVSGDGVRWLNAPDGGSEEEVARIKRLGDGNLLLDASAGYEFVKKITETWGSDSVINSDISNQPTGVILLSGVVRVAYKRNSDNYLVERVWSGSAWGSESVINSASSSYPAYIQLPDGELRICYQRGSDNYLVERVWSGSAWGSESVINSASSSYPVYIQLSDDELRVAYVRGSDGYLVERVWSGSAWGSESVVNSASSSYPAYIQLSDGELRVAYVRGSDGAVVERIWSGSAWGSESVINAGPSYYTSARHHYVQTIDGVLRIGYQRGSDGYFVERIWSGSAWGSESVVDNTGFSAPFYLQDSAGTLRVIFRRYSDAYLVERRLERYSPIMTEALPRPRAWVHFNPTVSANLTGTYSRTGTTVTVTCTNHGHKKGHRVYLDFTSGAAVDGSFEVDTVIDEDTFTIIHGTSGTTSGNVSLLRRLINNSRGVHSVVYEGVGLFAVNLDSDIESDYYATSCGYNSAANGSDVTHNANMYEAHAFCVSRMYFRIIGRWTSQNTYANFGPISATCYL